MAPPFRVDTEIPVEFDEREDLQGTLQNSPERRGDYKSPVVELDESGTSRDETTHGRQRQRRDITSAPGSSEPNIQTVPIRDRFMTV